MPRLVLLRCPLCNSVRALEGKQSKYAKDELDEISKDHLRDHQLSESKVAIRKYGMIEDAVELIIAADDVEQLATGEWRNHGETGLPEDVLSRMETSTARAESSVGATPS